MNKKEIKIINCIRCGKEMDIIDAFSGNLCLSCCDKEYENMTAEEKKPHFDSSLIK